MKWMEIAREELGVSEVAGKIARPRIIEYFAAAGHPEVKSDETAWCSAFANFCMERAGIKGTMSLAARSWLRWGRPCSPKAGCVMVFKRGTSSWQGHVGFYVSETPTHYEILGGNQDNSVSIRRYPKTAFLGSRCPVTMTNSRTAKAAIAGTAATGASFLMEQATEAKAVAESLQPYLEWATVAVVVLTIACFALVTYYRWQDLKEKGR
ncbi:MAG: TIGR02594 family protein [Armatimonadia bacterium]